MKPLFNPKSVYTWNKKSHRFVLDISLDNYTDLFDEWDYSPYRKRDIDSAFFQYLLESSQEIPLKTGITILFHLPETVFDQHKETQSRSGILNYLSYQLKKKRMDKQKLLSNTLWYSAFGLAFLVLGYFAQHFVHSAFLLNILPEGLYIGGWVLFWESFSIVFFQTRNVKQEIRHYQRLIHSDYLYQYESAEKHLEQVTD